MSSFLIVAGMRKYVIRMTGSVVNVGGFAYCIRGGRSQGP